MCQPVSRHHQPDRVTVARSRGVPFLGRVFACASVWLSVGCTSPADTRDTRDAVDNVTADESARIDSIFSRFERSDGPGCAVGVSTAGTLRFAKGYGLASIEQQRPIDAHTAFNIGSIGKQFTATAVLLLEQRGALSLDDSVARFVAGLPRHGSMLRIRDLLYHTSGVRDFGALGMLTGDFARSMNDFRSLMRRQQGLNFPTGTRHDYSHSDYTLLADVIEGASGMPYAQFLETELFTPLGMSATRIRDGRRRPIAGMATAYERDGDSLRSRFPSSELIGGDNVYTTVGDLLRWAENSQSARVGGAALVARTQSPVPLSLPYVMPYSHGVWLQTYRGEPLLHRSGGGGGFSTTYLNFPDAQLAVTALCNESQVHPFVLAMAVADGFLTGRPVAVDSAADTIPVPASEAVRFAGRYASTLLPWDPINLVAHDGQLYERLHGDSVRMARLRDGRYVVDGFFYRFAQGDDGRLRLYTSSDEHHEEATRLPDDAVWQTSLADLSGYAGRWLSDELPAVWSTTVRDGRLILQRANMDDVALDPIAPNLFRAVVLNGAGYPATIGLDFGRDASGISRLRVSTIPASFEAALGVQFTRLR